MDPFLTRHPDPERSEGEGSFLQNFFKKNDRHIFHERNRSEVGGRRKDSSAYGLGMTG